MAVSAAALVAATPALAGDFNYGAVRLKDQVRGAAVPVPAPAPIPETVGWYLRGDIGYTVGSGGSISTKGPSFGAYSAFDDVSGPFVGTLGVGRYVTPNVRAEFTFDFRNERRLSSGRAEMSNVSHRETGIARLPIAGVSTGYETVSNYSITADDQIKTSNQQLMFNVYHDFTNRTGFTPYIGAGIGVNVRTTKRKLTASGTCTGSYDTYTLDAGGARVIDNANAGCRSGAGDNFDQSHSSTDTGYGVAAALMAGAGITVASGVTVDMGYRFMWQQQNYAVDYGLAGITSSRVSFDGRTDHELRTGVRIDLE